MGTEVLAIAGLVAAVGGTAMAGQASHKAAYASGDAEFSDALAQARLIRKAAIEQRSQTQAAYAGAGVDVSQGTPLAIDRYIVQQSEEDALNTILTGRLRRETLRKGGQAAQTAGYINAGATALSGYANSPSVRSGVAKIPGTLTKINQPAQPTYGMAYPGQWS